MNVWFSLMIVAFTPDASMEGRPPEATELLRCAFDQAVDRDYDGWPDGWTRRQGLGFPRYVKVAIDGQRTPSGGHALRVDLDGGGAVAYSPSLPAGSLYDYILEGQIRTEGLEYDVAYLSITVRDEKGKVLEVFTSEKVREAPQWRRVRLGPVSPKSPQARSAVIGLHVQPTVYPDLKGSAMFGDLWLGRLPRMVLSAEGPSHVFTSPDEIAVTCRISGFSRPAPKVDFELLDAAGRRIARSEERLLTQPASETTGEAERALPDEARLIGTARWKPPVPGPGFYRVATSMVGERAAIHRRELTLAVTGSDRGPSSGEFGWSLSRGHRPLALAELGQLLTQAGVHWIKYPLWYSPQTPEATFEEVGRFLERLSLHGIETVGILATPPDDLRLPYRPARTPLIADVLSAGREVWYPSLEATVARLGAQVRWWQLGDDRDGSFIGYPRLPEKIAQVKAELDRVGCDAHVGFHWRWMQPLPEPAEGKVPWQFLALDAEPPLTHQELAVYLAAARRPDVRRWVALEPLARGQYSLADRVLDLVQRIMAAKNERAEGIFVPEPFSTDRGLMNDDGTPGELFLPWRTTASLLGGSEPLGTMPLPGGSSNQLYGRIDDAVMVVWSRKPVQEALYLGEAVRQVDVWGRDVPVKRTEAGQVLEVGPEPTFVTGLHKEIASWRLAFLLAGDRLPSVFGQRHRNRFELKNTFAQGIEGSVLLSGPEGWKISPPRTGFHLAPGETFSQSFDLILPGNTQSGPHLLRADLEVRSDRVYRFSALRPIHVGLGDVRIEAFTQLNAAGELEVKQLLTNETNRPVSFRCELFVPNGRRLSSQVVRLQHGQDEKTYRLADGRELLGKVLLLHAEQTDGPRALNCRIIAEE